MDRLIGLVSETFTTDSIGQRIPAKEPRKVWAHVQSVSRSEWFQGGQNGLRPSFVATTQIVNYKGERIVTMGDNAYTVYRTYRNDESDEIELYLEERVSNVNNSQH